MHFVYYNSLLYDAGRSGDPLGVRRDAGNDGQNQSAGRLVVLSVAVALLGLGLVAKRCLGNLRLREIVSYHLTADVVSLVSIVVLHFYMVDVSMIETLITGSVLSVLASVSVLFLAFRKKRYITVRRQQEDKRQMLAAKSGSAAVKE